MTEAEELELLELEAKAAKGKAKPAAPPPEPAKPSISPSAERWIDTSFGKRDKISENIGQFLAGAGDAGIKGYLGLKSFLPGGLNEDDKAVLQKMKEDAEIDSGWRTAGEIGGNLAATAIPGSVLAKSIGAVSKVPVGANALVRALAAASPAAGTSATTEALLSPSEKEDFIDRMKEKGENALKAAATGVGLSAGGQALTKAVTGMFTPTAEAVKLMSEGVIPKLQEGAENWSGKWIGKLTSGSSGTARQDKEVVDAFVNRIAPKIDTEGATTSQIVGLAKASLQKEHDDLIKSFPIVNGKPRITPDDISKFDELNHRSDLYDILEKAGGTLGGQKSLDATALVAAARDLHGEKAIAAANYPGSDLLEPAFRLIGEGGNQQSSRTGVAAAKRILPLLGGGGAAFGIPGARELMTTMAPLYGISAAGQTGRGARLLFGQTNFQKSLKKSLEALGPYLSASGADPNYGGQ